MAAMKEMYPGIFLVTERGGWGPMRPPMNIYVLTGDQGLVYDAGYGTGESVRCLTGEIRSIEGLCRVRGEACSIARVLPSHAHPDHFSGLGALRDGLGLKILLTQKMADTIGSREAYRESYRIERKQRNTLARIAGERVIGPIVSRFYEALYGTRFIGDPDEIIDENAALDIGGRKWRLIPSPGHSPDHISLYNEESGILLGGDNVLRSVTTWLGPPKSNLDDYIHTLETIRDLPRLRVILGSHGSAVDNPRERVDEIIRWRRRRLDHVLEAVRNGGPAGITKEEALRSIYRGEGMLKRFMADGWVDLSLRSLADDGRIREISPGRYRCG